MQLALAASIGVTSLPTSVYHRDVYKRQRRALGEDKSSRRYIETISRKGYRLVVPVGEPIATTIIPNVCKDSLPSLIAAAATPAVSLQSGAGDDAVLPHAIASKPFVHRIVASSLAVVTIAALVTIGIARLSIHNPPSNENSQHQPTSIGETVDITSQPEPIVQAPLPETLQGDVSYRQSIESLNEVLALQSAQGGKENLGQVSTLVRLATLYLLCSEPLKSEQASRRGLAILTRQDISCTHWTCHDN
jgi:hypothetical protein